MVIKIFLKKGCNSIFALFFLLLLMSASSWAQKKVTISGSIIDASGKTIPGVNIIEKGTKNAVSADFDGNYKINVAGSNSVLVFSALGYEALSRTVGKNQTLNVVLKDATSKLEEVVVIGYGTARKSDLTGAVASISGADLKKVSMPNVAEALTGRIAGVQVTSSEGAPDADIKIRIRGNGSISQDSSPLLIVDGFPVNSISDISPSDIQSITVLKDASSTAIYGSRGSNGVILVTTKAGNDSKMVVSLNSSYGTKVMAKYYDVLQPEDYIKWQHEYALLSSSPTASNPSASFEKYFGLWQDRAQYTGQTGTNWQKEIFGRLGKVQSHDLGIRGGTDKMNYSFNFARYQEDAIMLGSDFKRNNLSLSLKNKASDKVDLTFTMRYSDTEVNGAGANDLKEVSSADSRLRHVVGYSPVPFPDIITDDVEEALSGHLINPLTAVADNGRMQFRKNFNMLGSFSWKIFNDFQFKSELGLDNRNDSDYRFYGLTTYYVLNNTTPYLKHPALTFGDSKQVKYRNANTINYDFKKILGASHKLKFLLGEEMISLTSNIKSSEVQNFPDFYNFDKALHLTTSGVAKVFDNHFNPDDNLLSFFGRMNYDFKSRYLFTATFRADGSSKFLGDNRWGYFPSAAVAWKLNEENFLKDQAWINTLKMRLSYGQAGNNNIPTGQTLQTFESYVPSSVTINGVTNYWGASSAQMANPKLKWETTVTQNVGLDFGIFKNRINGSIEIYKNLTKDLLINFPVPGSGYVNQYRNLGEIQNTGVEATLNLAVIDKEDYGLNVSFNMGMNQNLVNSIGSMPEINATTNWASTEIGKDYVVTVGQPIGLIYGYKSDLRYVVQDFTYSNGVYTLKPDVANSSFVVGTVKPGTMKLKDIAGGPNGGPDGKVDAKDQTIIGNTNPKNTGGFVINANAYGFDLSASFNWSYGNQVYNADKIDFTTATSKGQYRNLSTVMADGNRWTNVDAAGVLVTDPTALAALNAKTTMWSPYMGSHVLTDWAIEDGSFLRLNSLSLGYTAPKTFVSKLSISKLRVYSTMNNVFILTNYSGSDPEVSTRRATPLTPGVDSSAYPRSRQIVFGLNLTF
jgi:TonB-linked SusC/RagA family outer membrane protein